MKTSTEESSSSPSVHAENLQSELSRLIDHLRVDNDRVKDPRFRALCETSAEVVRGLHKAFADYAKGDEPAWRR